MSNYTKQISWSGKDALSDSDSEKVISGGDFDTEFSAVQTAINSKIDGGTITNFTSTGIDDNATSTAITIDASENVEINTGNLIIGTSGKGIMFSPFDETVSTPGSDSNLLDDYEEGTFTLTTEGDATGTLDATKIGTYTKIGNIVHVALSFQVTANFTDVTIGGLPYASNFGGLFSSALPTSGVQTSLDVNITGKLTRNATTIDFYNNTGLTSGHAPNTTNQYYRLSATYRTDS